MTGWPLRDEQRARAFTFPALLRAIAWGLDELLDRVPCREGGRWYRYGQWGCRLRLHRFWRRGRSPVPG